MRCVIYVAHCVCQTSRIEVLERLSLNMSYQVRTNMIEMFNNNRNAALPVGEFEGLLVGYLAPWCAWQTSGIEILQNKGCAEHVIPSSDKHV